MTMGVVMVTKSSPVLVRASKPVTTSDTTIKLSSFDSCYIKVPSTALFVFDKPIHEPAETIKRGLSQALIHYYPMTGRIIAVADDDDDGLHVIQCTEDGVGGVPFVAASSDSSLKDVKLLEPSSSSRGRRPPVHLLEELALYYDDEGYGPLLMVQVTEFSCGGFVVGVTWDHALADGYGMAQFIRAVGEMACNGGLSPPSVVPVRRDDSLPSLPEPTVALTRFALTLPPLDGLVFLDVTIPSSAIDRVRGEYRARSSAGQSCTVFDAVAAVLWRCRTRAIGSSPESPAALSFSANVRKQVGAEDGYYGNCFVAQLVMAASGTVSNGDIADVIQLIKDAKDRIPLHFNNETEEDGVVTADHINQLFDSEARYKMLLTLSSWRNLGFEELDFGGGKPARVMFYEKPTVPPLAACVTGLPSKGMDGTNVLSLCVRKEHADAFLAELASLA